MMEAPKAPRSAHWRPRRGLRQRVGHVSAPTEDAACGPQHRRRSEQNDHPAIVSPAPAARSALSTLTASPISTARLTPTESCDSIANYNVTTVSHVSLITHGNESRHNRSNRQPRRLETVVTCGKRTAATGLHHQLCALCVQDVFA